MVSDSRGIRPQPASIIYKKERKKGQNVFFATSREIGIKFVKIERDVVVRFSFGVN